MAQFVIEPDAQQIGEVAAAKTAEYLNNAIQIHGNAVWVLAGGTAPMIAYKVLAERYIDKVDWSKVTVLIGDERCVPLDHPDSNWHQIAPIFLDRVPIPAANKLRPKSDLPAEEAAAHYADELNHLPRTKAGLPRLDVVWLGMGEDGHTLSLFPGRVSELNAKSLVIPVHDSPKPPPDRITLTLKALETVSSCIIMAAGASKSEVIAKIKQGDASLPIAQAVQTIEAANGEVIWLVDPAAYGEAASAQQDRPNQ